MISVGSARMSREAEGQNFGFKYTEWLQTPTGTTTFLGTPTVNGVNCTVTYIDTVGDIVEFNVVAAAGLARGARGEAQVSVTLANGEAPKRKIDLTFD